MKKVSEQPSPSRIRIRPARPRDAEALLPLIRAYYRFDHIRFHPRVLGPALDRLLRSRSVGRVWIINDDAQAIGYLVLTYNFDLEFGGIEGLVTDLFIAEAYRGRGLGRRALAVVDDYCRAQKIGMIELQVEQDNVAAQQFYRTIGFKQLTRIVMTRNI